MLGNVPLPLFKKIETAPDNVFAVAKSACPSPLKSPLATAYGLVLAPVDNNTGEVWNVPLRPLAEESDTFAPPSSSSFHSATSPSSAVVSAMLIVA